VHQLGPDTLSAPTSEIKVDIKPEGYIDDLGLFEDKKEYVKFMMRLKQMIRNSFEYTEAISFLKKQYGMNYCGIHPNLKMCDGFRIELHHTPLVLEDYCSIIINKRIKRGETLKMSAIASEVMEVHYLGLVGLYPLCELCHHFAHSAPGDELFIPMANVYGYPGEFMNIYGDFVPAAMKTKWENVQVLNKSYTMINNELPLELQKQYIYIDATEDDAIVPEGISTTKLVKFIDKLNKNEI